MTQSNTSLIIKIKKKVSAKVEQFYEHVWNIATPVYYGKQIDWTPSVKVIEAYDNIQLVGVIELHVQSGVMYIFELAVAYSHQKKGIGSILVQRAEKIARDAKIHKIHLDTGKTWGTGKFYEKLGYIKTGEFPKHYGGHDYIQYSKFL